MGIRENAVKYHDDKFNCAQAVVAALSGELGVDEKEMLAIAGGFGGGVRAGEICGAVSGAVMAISLKYRFDKLGDLDAKAVIGEKTMEFHRRFKEKNGDQLRCTDLVGMDMSTPEAQQRARETGRMGPICKKAIGDAAEIALEMIRESD